MATHWGNGHSRLAPEVLESAIVAVLRRDWGRNPASVFNDHKPAYMTSVPCEGMGSFDCIDLSRVFRNRDPSPRYVRFSPSYTLAQLKEVCQSAFSGVEVDETVIEEMKTCSCGAEPPSTTDDKPMTAQEKDDAGTIVVPDNETALEDGGEGSVSSN